MSQILLNSIKTPDGTIISSGHRHDYVTHLDSNGETYIVDGGFDYLKRSQNTVPYEDFSVDEYTPIEIARTRVRRWNTFDEEYVFMCDINDSWLDNIIKFYESDREVSEMGEHILNLYIKEKVYRRESRIEDILS